MSELLVNTIKKADGTGSLSVPAESGTVVTTASPSLGRRNLIINGAMQVAQRGTSTTGVTTTDGFYACDRWRTQTDINTWTISQSTDAPDGFGYSFKCDVTSGTQLPNADEVSIRYHIEGQDLQSLGFGTSSAQSFTVSFWIKSNKTGTYTLSIKNLNSTQERMAGFNYTIDAADTWEKKTITFAGDTSYGIDNNNSTGFQMFWWFSAASAFTSGSVSNTWQNYSAGNHADSSLAGLGGSTNDYVNITGVQLEVGSVATPFEHRSYGEELALCQRYYWRKDATTGSWSAATQRSTTQSEIGIQHPISMRAKPTLGYSGTWNIGFWGSSTTISSFTFNVNGIVISDVQANHSSGGSSGRAVEVYASAGAYMDFDAEL